MRPYKQTTPVVRKVTSLRPASRDKSDDARSGNTNPVHPVRGDLAITNNRRTIEQASYLPPSPPQSPAGEAIKRIVVTIPKEWHRQVWARTSDQTLRSNQTPGSFQTYLLFTMHAEHAPVVTETKLVFSSEDITKVAVQLPTGARHHADRSAARPERSAAKAARQRQDKILVELSGIEPLTPCLQSRCSPS
jgi:hypothetical protein